MRRRQKHATLHKKQPTNIINFMNVFFRYALLAIMLLAGAACQKKVGPKVYVIKYATHPALDEVEAAFADSLEGHVVLIRLNAQGNRQRAKESAETATQAKASLIVTLGTPATQAAVNTASSIPILFGAVSDPDGAGIAASGRATGIKNVDIMIVREALKTIKADLLPKLETLGTIYNSGEQNSVYVQGLLSEVCKEENVRLESRRITDSTQIASVTEELASGVDAIYSANDNMVNLGVSALAATSIAKKKLLVMGEVSTIEKGPAVTIGVNYRETGKTLASMALDILSAQGNPLPPIKSAPTAEIWINEGSLKAVGISLSDSLRKRATKIID